MAAGSTVRKSGWILTIALTICALVAVPGTGVFSPALAPPGAQSAGASPTLSVAPTHTLSTATPSESASSPLSLVSTLNTPLAKLLKADDARAKAAGMPPLPSIPSAALLAPRAKTSQEGIVPLYTEQPAPIGVSDIGLGSGGPYAYNTTHVLGQFTFNTPPNVTNPGTFQEIDPGGLSQGWDTTTYEFSIQLNTVLTNVTQPGSADGVYWTQNILQVSDTGIHLYESMWNDTGPVFGTIALNALLAGCPGGPSVRDILTMWGFYWCIGTTIPISPANFPLTISLYNNASVNSAHEDVLAYGYRFTGADGLSATGVSDRLTFNSTGYYNGTGYAKAPVFPVGFEVNGYYSALNYVDYDAEMVLGGAEDGSNSVFSSLNGTASLQYENNTGGWQNIRSAYNFGINTGETATGVATYWTAAHKVVLNAGPTFLYGLWNAIPRVSVPSGRIQFAGSIYPNYGFVFLSNIPSGITPSNPTGETNFTWVPTTPQGTWDTYLPPSVPPSTSYYVQAFAAEFKEWNSSTPFTGSRTNYKISMTPAKGVLRAPLYMTGNAQAADLYENVTGLDTPPYLFENLVIYSNITFNHLNDWEYPTFGVFSSQEVTNGLTVSNITQGPDSGPPSVNGFFYVVDYPITATPGLIYPAGSVVGPLPFYTDQIQVMDGSHTRITDETLPGTLGAIVQAEGGVIFLWADTTTSVRDINATDYSWGVFVGDSEGVTVQDVLASSDAYGVSDVGSTGTVVSHVTATLGGAGVFVLSSTRGSYSWVQATDAAVGVLSGEFYNGGFPPGYLPSYYAIPGADSATINGVSASASGVGVNLTFSTDVTVTNLRSFADGEGAVILHSAGTTLVGVRVYDGEGVDLLAADSTQVTYVTVENGGTGVAMVSSTNIDVSEMMVSNLSTGVQGNASSRVVVSHVLAWESSTGVSLTRSSDVRVSHVTAWDHSVGVRLEKSSRIAVSEVLAVDYSIGVYLYASTMVTISHVSARDHSIAIYIA